VSIRRRLGLDHRCFTVSDSLVVAQARNWRLAIIAESLQGVVERPADAFVNVGDLAQGVQHIEGLLKTSDGLVLIHDLERFFSPEEEKSLDLALERS